MNIKAILLSITFGLFSFTAVAGGGHDHGHGHSHSSGPVNQVTAKANASKVVASLVQRNKLDKSWTSAEVSSIEKKVFKGKPEWVVVFQNNKAADPAKQKLYVFLTLSGDYIAANHSGN